MLGIVNYGIGNLASVQNALCKIGATAIITQDPESLKTYDHLILPGVGAFGDAMQHLKHNGMREAVLEFAKSGKPLLGICLGMQLLFDKSYEFGEHLGLGLIKGEVIPFEAKDLDANQKIPQMGWNRVTIHQTSSLLKGLESPFYLYFVHSYYVKNLQNAIGISQYGMKFASIVQKDNVFGIQPHPEKSHNVGLRILQNFTNL